MNSPLKKEVSIIIPARNEEKFIGKCLQGILSQDYPHNNMEIIVVDGASLDKTKEVVGQYSERYPFIRIIDNPKKITPVSMNIGVKNAHGDFVGIFGAHSELISNDYIKQCLEAMRQHNADVGGGVVTTTPASNSLAAQAIALVLTHRLGTGGAKFREGVKTIVEADTAFNCFYRKGIFQKAGFFNEQLTRSQDMDLSIRIKKTGGKIILVPSVQTRYFPKSRLGGFLQHNIKDGIWAILPMKYTALPLKLRHFIPLLFVVSIIVSFFLSPLSSMFFYFGLGILVSYFATIFIASILIALKEKRLMLLPYLVVAFVIRHFGYGVGSLVGLVKLII